MAFEEEWIDSQGSIPQLVSVAAAVVGSVVGEVWAVAESVVVAVWIWEYWERASRDSVGLPMASPVSELSDARYHCHHFAAVVVVGMMMGALVDWVFVVVVIVGVVLVDRTCPTWDSHLGLWMEIGTKQTQTQDKL